MTTPHRATPEQWASVRRRAVDSGISDCCAIMELSARIEALEATQHARAERQGQPTPIATDEELQKAWTSLPGQGWNAALRAVYDLGRQHGSAQATCPHIVSGAEGTSYCRLAEQTAAPVTPMDELRAASAEARPAVGGPVDRLMAQGYGKTHARAAIREVVQTLRASFFEHAAKWLEQEAGLG